MLNLEPVTQNEVSWKQKISYKNRYRILMHMCGIWKNGTDEPIIRAGIEMQMHRTDRWTQRGKKVG